MAWDYVYKDETEYLISTQAEKVEFAIYQITSQLESVNKRLYLVMDEFKVNSALFIAILIVYGISFLVIQSPSVILRIIAAIPYVLSVFALLFLSPVLIYKAVNGFVQYQLNMHSDRYVRLMSKYGILTYEAERRRCQKLLTMYQGYMERIEELKTLKQNGQLELSASEISEEFDEMKLDETVPVANPYTGKLAVFTKVCTAIMYILPFAIAMYVIISFARSV